MTLENTNRTKLRRERAEAQLLSTKVERSVENTVSHLLAVQAQDLTSAKLALRARSSRLTVEDVDRALTVDRSLVVAWLGRGTLHLVHSDDYPWLLALTAPSPAASNRREAADAEAAGSSARLLPAFDPYLLGWKDRGFMVEEAHKHRVHPGGGVLRATVVADGKAMGTWSLRRDGERIKIRIDPFAPFTDEVEADLRQDALDVARFEGLALSR